MKGRRMPALFIILDDKQLRGCVAQLVEQRSPKPSVGGSNPSALDALDRTSKRGIKVGAEVKSMEIKKPQQTTTEQTLSSKRMQDFVTDIKSEIQKITWTNREELIFYTKVVVGTNFVFGMAIYTLDLLIQATLGSLNFLLHLITG